MRAFAEASILLICVFQFARTWLIQGIVIPLRVASGSMWPALLGPHYALNCESCGLPFHCGADELPPDRTALCPRCGASVDISPQPVLPGERILVNRAAYLFSPPRRWDIVVARCPENPQASCVKRVVGLPGERVAFPGGNVTINGTLGQRPLATVVQMLIPMHIEPFSASSQPAGARWTPAATSHWRRTSKGFICESNSSESVAGEPDWLVYHHQHVSKAGLMPSPILDDASYAQAESRELVPVADIALRARLKAESANFSIRLASEDSAVHIAFDTNQGRGLFRENKHELPFNFDRLAPGRAATILVALIDTEIRVGLEQQEVFRCASLLQTQALSPMPLAIGIQSGRVQVLDLEVLRDVHYIPSQSPAALVLGSDEVFLLGDNAGQSLDSRAFGAVKLGAISGKCLSW